jgi:RsiW-degrading membrane proteinase PrsW (M82 family)/ribosomal protein L40E
MILYLVSFLLTILFWLWIILKYDRFEREPLKSILLVMVAGGILSAVVAGLFNYLFMVSINYRLADYLNEQSFLYKKVLLFIFVGFNEEFLKATVAVLLIRKMKGFNEPADALVYAMTVAFGFSLVENIEYVTKLGYFSFIVRQFNAVPLHIGLAAVWGTGIAKAKFTKNGKYFPTMMPYVIIAALLHCIYNIVATVAIFPIIELIVVSIFSFFLIRLAIKKIKRYAEDGPFSNRLYCHNCNTANFPDARMCKKCGQKFHLEFYELCSGCNAKIPKQAINCPKCGNELIPK